MTKVYPIVADYIDITALLKRATTPQAKRKYAYMRDQLWESMTSDAQWQVVDILTIKGIKYSVTCDE